MSLKICALENCNNYVKKEKAIYCSKQCSIKACHKKSLKQLKLKTFNKMKKTLKQYNCKLLSDISLYTNCRDFNLEIKCSCSKISKVSWESIKNCIRAHNTYQCSFCRKGLYHKKGIKNKYTLKEIKTLLEKLDLIYISGFKKNTDNIIKVQCLCGVIFKRELASILYKNKNKCKECIYKINKKYVTKKQQIKEFLEVGNSFITQSIQKKRIKDLIEYKCKCGKIEKISLGQALKTKKCIECRKKEWKINNPEEIKKISKKIYDTKKKNNSFNVSKPEKTFETFLKKNNINYIFQYKSKEYPYYCDFYIPLLNLYIELNFHWTHGKEPFNKKDKNHKLIIEKWKKKNTKFYKTAIYVWTILDIKKRKLAKKNKLNFLEVYIKKEKSRNTLIFKTIVLEFKEDTKNKYYCLL